MHGCQINDYLHIFNKIKCSIPENNGGINIKFGKYTHIHGYNILTEFHQNLPTLGSTPGWYDMSQIKKKIKTATSLLGSLYLTKFCLLFKIGNMYFTP